MVLEKTLESPLDCKETQPVLSEGDQPWDFFGRTDAEAETPVLWPPHVKSWLIGKDPDARGGLGAGGEGDDRGWDGWMASPTRRTWVWLNSGSWWWTGSWRAAIHGVAKNRTQLSDWTELNWLNPVQGLLQPVLLCWRKPAWEWSQHQHTKPYRVRVISK